MRSWRRKSERSPPQPGKEPMFLSFYINHVFGPLWTFPPPVLTRHLHTPVATLPPRYKRYKENSNSYLCSCVHPVPPDQVPYVHRRKGASGRHGAVLKQTITA